MLKAEFFDAASHRGWETSSHSFGITCGVFLSFAPNPFGGRIPRDANGALEPDGTICAIRTQLLRTLDQSRNVPENVWSVADDLSDLDVVVSNAQQVFESHGLRWFNRFSSLREIVEFLQHADEEMEGDASCFGFGRKGSPIRNLYLGYALAAAGDRHAACDALIASMSKGGFARLSGSTEVDDLVRGKITELHR